MVVQVDMAMQFAEEIGDIRHGMLTVQSLRIAELNGRVETCHQLMRKTHLRSGTCGTFKVGAVKIS